MRAISFNVTVPSFLIGKGLGGLTESAVFGALSGVRFGAVSEPPLPAEDWVQLEILKAGICGTDIGTLTFKASPAMEPFASFPAVLGHEILARVLEVGPAVRSVEPGQRVAVDPMISCTMRGFGGDARCRSCSAGLHCTCERSGEEGALTVDGAAPSTKRWFRYRVRTSRVMDLTRRWCNRPRRCFRAPSARSRDRFVA